MNDPKQHAAPDTRETGHTAPETAPQAAGACPRKVRRVGTFTFGVVLVLAGALLVLSLFLPALDLWRVLRFAPLILVALGIEVLVYAARPDVKLKYDFLGMVVCFLLLVGVGGCALVGRVLETSYAEQRLRQQLDTQSYAALKDLTAIRSVESSLELRRLIPADADLTELLNDCDEVWAFVTLDGDCADRQQFATVCRSVLDAAQSAGLPYTGYQFSQPGKEAHPDFSRSYTLTVSGPWETGQTAEQLADSTDSCIWYDQASFDSEAELNRYLAQFDEEAPFATGETADSLD
ncbi:hypothetical protein [uncultured Gemmiger sp.]|uniref:hypothetical protein n=1 Tax=uncultured Gemmiger sp. TaxID=1623490 RepID=UPI0025DDB4D5|nr:hypothetical protein [uncultured Gemmiger sp.]